MKTTFFNSWQISLKGNLILFSLLLLVFTAQSQTIGDYRSATTGNWGSASTWQRWDGSTWASAALVPGDNTDGLTISIRSSHNVTLAATITNGISRTVIESGGTLTVASGKTLRFGAAVSGNKIAVNGTLVNNGTIVFSGTSLVNAGGLLENTSGSTLTFSGSTLQLDVNGTLRNSSINVTTAKATVLHFNNGSVYDHILSSSYVIPKATWNVGSTISISANTSVTIPSLSNSDQSFYNLTWNTPGLTSNIAVMLESISGNLIINSTGSGTLFIQTLSSIGGNFTTTSSSTVALGAVQAEVKGSITFASSSVTSTGNTSLTLNNTTVNQTVDVKGLTIEKLAINKPGLSVSLNSSLKITGSLVIESINTTVNSNGYLRLLSLNDEEGSQNGSIGILPSGSTVTGVVQVDHYMSNEGNIYRYISSPVANFPVSGLQAAFPVTGNFIGASSCANCASQTSSMFYYAAATSSYVAFPKSPQRNTATFEVGRGYSAFVNQNTLAGPATIQWSGTINHGTINLPVVFNGNPNTSWNLVGNPYPSTVNWSNAAGWTLTNVAQAIAVKDNATGVFQYYPDNGGNETFNSGMIAKGQAFWIRTTGTSPLLQIREEAKSSDVGTFYRTASESVDRIMLSLSNGSTSDRTYFKIVKGAAQTIDDYDAPKMINDGIGTLNFSSFMKNSSFAMAINAVDGISCGDTIRLKVNGAGGQSLASGNYTIGLLPTGLMSEFTWTLNDTYLKSSITISEESKYSFSVTNVAASRSANRFQLIAVSKPANTALKLDAAKSLCGEVNNLVKVANTEAEVQYAVFVNGKQVSDMVDGNGSDVTLSISGSSFLVGSNTVKVLASTSCKQVYLVDTVVVSKSAYYSPQVQTVSRCQPGIVTLSVTDAPEGNTARWYSSNDSQTILATGVIFVTPSLDKTKTYYVAGVNAMGCEGSRLAIQAKVITYDELKISADKNSATLQSNYANGNQWYFNDEIITDATSQIISADKQGVYSVSVSIGSCIASAQYKFAPETNVTVPVTTPALEPVPVVSTENKILVYPNPVGNSPLNIQVSENTTSVKILDSMGAVIEDVAFTESESGTKKATVDLRQRASGVYFVSIKQDGKIITTKVFNK